MDFWSAVSSWLWDEIEQESLHRRQQLPLDPAAAFGPAAAPAPAATTLELLPLTREES